LFLLACISLTRLKISKTFAKKKSPLINFSCLYTFKQSKEWIVQEEDHAKHKESQHAHSKKSRTRLLRSHQALLRIAMVLRGLVEVHRMMQQAQGTMGRALKEMVMKIERHEDTARSAS
jgi:hypothetical protein